MGSPKLPKPKPKRHKKRCRLVSAFILYCQIELSQFCPQRPKRQKNKTRQPCRFILGASFPMPLLRPVIGLCPVPESHKTSSQTNPSSSLLTREDHPLLSELSFRTKSLRLSITRSRLVLGIPCLSLLLSSQFCKSLLVLWLIFFFLLGTSLWKGFSGSWYFSGNWAAF